MAQTPQAADTASQRDGLGRLAQRVGHEAVRRDWWGFFGGSGGIEGLAVTLGWAAGAPPPTAAPLPAGALEEALSPLRASAPARLLETHLGIGPSDMDLLLQLVALACDGPVGALFRARSPGGVPDWLWARWLDVPLGRLADDRPLCRSGAVVARRGPGGQRILAPAEATVATLQGAAPPLQLPLADWVAWPGLRAVEAQVADVLGSGDPTPLLVVGPEGQGRRTALKHWAAGAQRPVVFVDIAEAGAHDALVDRALWARVHDALVVILGDGAESPHQARRLAQVFGASQVRVVVLATEANAEVWQTAWPSLAPAQWTPPDSDGLAALVTRFMARLGWAEDAGQARWLARTYRLRPRDLWLSLRDLGQGAGAALDEAALDGRIRARLRTRLAALADPIEVHQGWDALVLAESQRAVVQEIVAHARHGHTVLDQWGFSARFGPRHSVSCLFSGPPGTGKTLTAGLIAEALGLPAFRVDLARVVDKYVGETEKNLGRLFDEAERVPVVLVFDEADALFGERTEQKSSQDRYANLEVNYLLQRMERFGGISVLTTNRAAVIDPAFRRRLRFHVHFDLPEVADRQRLWEAMIPPGCLLGEVDFGALARRWRISGALIRKAVLRGAFLAAARGQALDGALLDEATRLELAEAGRLASEP